jgi:hypothetical protein
MIPRPQGRQEELEVGRGKAGEAFALVVEHGPPAGARLRPCSSSIRSSIVPSAISLQTNTGSSWPMRCARSAAARRSTAGFHHGS